MEKGKPDGLMPYATPDLIREMVTLVDRLLTEVGHATICESDYVYDEDIGEEMLEWCENEVDSKIYNKIIDRLSAIRNDMTEPPPKPDRPEGDLTRKADGTLFIKGFFDE